MKWQTASWQVRVSPDVTVEVHVSGDQSERGLTEPAKLYEVSHVLRDLAKALTGVYLSYGVTPKASGK